MTVTNAPARFGSFRIAGTRPDSRDDLASFARHRNAPKRDRPPIFLDLNRCDYSVCHGDLLRAGHHNL